MSPSNNTDLIFCPAIALLSSTMPAATAGSLFNTSILGLVSSLAGVNFHSSSKSLRTTTILSGFHTVMEIWIGSVRQCFVERPILLYLKYMIVSIKLCSNFLTSYLRSLYFIAVVQSLSCCHDVFHDESSKSWSSRV